MRKSMPDVVVCDSVCPACRDRIHKQIRPKRVSRDYGAHGFDDGERFFRGSRRRWVTPEGLQSAEIIEAIYELYKGLTMEPKIAGSDP